MSDITIKDEENIFQIILGCTIANRISINYNGYAEVELRPIKPYIANKLIQAYKAEEKVLKALKITDKYIESKIDTAATMYSDLITDIIELDEVDQKRVQGLIKKLRKENKNV